MNPNLCTESFQNLIYHNAFETINKLISPKLSTNNHLTEVCILETVATHSSRTNIQELSNRLLGVVKPAPSSRTWTQPPPPGFVLNDIESLEKHELKSDGSISRTIHRFGTEKKLEGFLEEKGKEVEGIRITIQAITDMDELIDGGQVFDVVIVLTSLNWVSNPEYILVKLGDILRDPEAEVYLLTWDGYPTSFLHATQRILRTPFWQSYFDEGQPAQLLQKYPSLVDVKEISKFKVLYAYDLLPWKRSWMDDRKNVVVDDAEGNTDKARSFLEMLQNVGFNEVLAFFLEKVSYYCFESEDAIKDMVRCVFMDCNHDSHSDKLIVPASSEEDDDMREKFVEAFAEYIMEDNALINGHRLNSFQSLMLVKASCLKPV